MPDPRSNGGHRWHREDGVPRDQAIAASGIPWSKDAAAIADDRRDNPLTVDAARLSRALAIQRSIDQIEATQVWTKGNARWTCMTDDLVHDAARSGPATSEGRTVA
jgi:hypothetical protein